MIILFDCYQQIINQKSNIEKKRDSSSQKIKEILSYLSNLECFQINSYHQN